MKIKLALFPYLAILIGGIYPASSMAAMLGDIHVRSALGERFEANISVAAADDEDLNSMCFRLVTPHDGNEQNVLRRAKLIYQQEGNGGRLLVRGIESQVEPVVTVSVRVKCPGEEERVFQRDYNVLLDPREYKAPVRQMAADVVRNMPSQRALPRLGSAWLTEEGDTVANISRRYYPKDEKLRARFVEGIFELNPDLPQSSLARLGSDWRLQLPPAIAKESLPAPRAQQILPMSAAEATPRLTLDPAPAMKLPAAPVASGGSGEFRLRLSDASLNLEQKNNLSPEETLRLRERLLSLESDEQASQMLQLKDQITQLEKQLASLRSDNNNSSAVVSVEAHRAPASESYLWLWASLLGLLGIAAVVWYWRKQQRQSQEEPFSMLGISTIHVGSPYAQQHTGAQRENSTFNSQFMTKTGGFDADEIAIPVRRLDENEWQNEDMDVVSPNSVAEEAQLLIDHGLSKQAINLLMHEVAERPSSLALWMKLFDIFHQNKMVDLYQERAVAFRLQFSSDALWQQVQALGAELEPNNPLYQSLDAMSDLPSPTREAPAMNDATLAAALFNDVGLTPPVPIQPAKSGAEKDFDFVIDYPEIENQMDLAVVATPFEADLNEAEEISISVPVESQPVAASADFVSEDSTLQSIADAINQGRRKEAFERLEILLYQGTMPQRLTASKWLDKLLSKFGQP